MARRHMSFDCGGSTLAGTLDDAPGTTGLLLVSGGNETRAGAFSGQAQLAANIAAAGYPVFRFDRRGVGDSEGPNLGFRHSAADIAAALSAFRSAAPAITRVVGFGNCDAASALMLGSGAGLDGLILANPWTLEAPDSAPPPQAVRARYSEKLRNPREVWRLVTGGVSLSKLAGGIRQAMRPPPPPTGLMHEITGGLLRFGGSVSILLAERDRTAQAFDAVWTGGDENIHRCPGAGHAFAEHDTRPWLSAQIIRFLQQIETGS